MLSHRPCVQCGYCCTVAPCPFGDGIPCRFLTPEMLCSRYEEIRMLPGSNISPAFGTGCSSPIGNEMRVQKIKKLLEEKTNLDLLNLKKKESRRKRNDD